MTGHPGIKVWLDDGTGTFPTNITTYARLVEGYTLKRGRQDDQAQVNPGDLDGLSLDNTDGRFTPGSTIIGTPSPIKIDQQIRITETIPPDASSVNLLSAVNASFEDGTLGGWTAAGTVLPTVANSSARAYDGTKCMLITWQGSGSNPQAQVQPSGYTIGNTYTFAAYIYVPTGAPDVRIGAGSSTSGLTSIKDSWVRLSVTFVAASTTPTFFVRSSGAPAASTCYVDACMVVAGSTIGEFNTLTQTTYNRGTYYVQSWPTEWPSGGDTFAVCRPVGIDAQSKAEGWTLKSVIEQEILEDSPTSYYTLGEPAEAVSAADSSGNQATALTQVGSGTSVVFGSATGPATDGLTAAQFAGGKYLSTGESATITVGSFVCAFQSSTVAEQGLIGIPSGFLPGNAAPLKIDPTGHLAADAGAGIASASTVTDGSWHVAIMTITGGTATLYLDGTSVGTAAAASFTYALQVGRGLTGALAHIGLFSTALSGANAAAISSAILNGFAGESGTARITRLAGYANLPVGTLDTSLTNVAYKNFTGDSVFASLQAVADAEGGVAFVDGSGNWIFYNRNRPIAKTSPDITIDANYLAEGTRFELDMQGVINYFETTAQGTGVTQTVQSASSIVTNKHGKYDGSKTYLVQTDAEALDRANWIVGTHAEPASRVGSLEIDLLTMPMQLQQQFLAAEVYTWLRVTGLPGQTPGSTTADFIIEGFAENLTADAWTLSANASNKTVFYPTGWILDSATYSVLDSTTRLYV